MTEKRLYFCTSIITAIIILIAIPAFANPISDVPRGQAEVDLRAKLTADYHGKYSTIKMLLKSGMRSYDKLALVPDSAVSNEVIERLKADYYPSFATIWMLYRNEMEAYEELNGGAE